MSYFFLFGIVTLAGLMLFEDLRNRAISWPLFPLLWVCLVVYLWSNPQDWFFSTLVNLIFLGFNVLLTSVWFRLKGIAIKTLLQDYVGLGDLLLFLVLGLSLPYYVFIPFQIASLAISLSLGVSIFKGGTVPLAGLQAAMLGVLLITLASLQISIPGLEYLLL